MNHILSQIVTLLFLVNACGSAPTPLDSRLMDRQGPGAPLFSENSVLSVTIAGPIRQIFDEKERFVIFDSDNGEWEQLYRNGSLQFGSQVIPIKIRARGQGTRLGCAFPPLKIKLKAQ